MFGPIFRLRMLGLCPCLESDENRNARRALLELSAIGKVVEWHVGKKSGPRRFVQSLFRQNSNDDAPIPCQIQIVDGISSPELPELQIKPLKLAEKKTADIRLDIPLHHIQKIEDEGDSTIVIITKDVHSMDENRTTKVAARISLPSVDKRESVSLDLKLLIEWNKNRQPEIEEEFADGLRQKAKKAAHFAKRELELRETKKTREKRKQKYLEQGGGMKFTALAMANRET